MAGVAVAIVLRKVDEPGGLVPRRLVVVGPGDDLAEIISPAPFWWSRTENFWPRSDLLRLAAAKGSGRVTPAAGGTGGAGAELLDM